MDNNPIGVFDSGIGGLTAVQELSGLLPEEHIIFLGDSYNMPYGERTRQEIIDFSLKNLSFLLERGVKAVFVACGTATASAIDELRRVSPVPVFGVVEPAVREALELTKNRRIGVLATRASIRMGTFQGLLKQLEPSVSVEAQACPVFATMVEYGIFDKNDRRVRSAAQEYLPPLRSSGVDTVILGCTHYPLLSEVIREYVGEEVSYISSGAAAARALARYIKENGLEAQGGESVIEYYTTGERESFLKSASFMLGKDISSQLSSIAPL